MPCCGKSRTKFTPHHSETSRPRVRRQETDARRYPRQGLLGSPRETLSLERSRIMGMRVIIGAISILALASTLRAFAQSDPPAAVSRTFRTFRSSTLTGSGLCHIS